MNSNRRHFLSVAAAAAATPLIAAPLSAASAKKVSDWVPLGNTGVKVTRLAFGTGTHGGRVQRNLGQAEFTKLVRHAYDRGIRFFESADNYDGMHEMLAEALKGIPRENYRLMTKFKWREAEKPFETIDRFRRELNSDYFDILLMHNVKSPTWPTDLAALRDAFSEAKHKQIIRSHGCSGHGLLPVRAYPGTTWMDIALMRVNHDGTRMDNLTDDAKQKGERAEVLGIMDKVRQQGTAILGMKLIGEGAFTSPEQREASIRAVYGKGLVSAATIGFKSTAEIDEAVERIESALKA